MTRWDPLTGFNETRIVQLYDYYRDLFNSNESVFMGWSGSNGRCHVLGGLRRFLAQHSEDPSFLRT